MGKKRMRKMQKDIDKMCERVHLERFLAARIIQIEAFLREQGIECPEPKRVPGPPEGYAEKAKWALETTQEMIDMFEAELTPREEMH